MECAFLATSSDSGDVEEGGEMADIKQAAIWLSGGKRVTRAIDGMTHFSWAQCPTVMRECIGCTVYNNLGTEAAFTVHDLLADDWEIVPEGESK
jgi:hypothetical protein